MERKIKPPCEEGFVEGVRARCHLYEHGTCPVMSDIVATIRNNSEVHAGLQLREHASGQTAIVVMEKAVDKHCPTK